MLEIYGVKHKKEYVRNESRSGGIFTALSDYYINRGGYVCGCILDENLNPKHIVTNNFEERDLMRGSKYVQSDLVDCYKVIKELLEKNKEVLFTGTSCQVSGLKAYLGSRYDNQILYVDILCHGVPSPKVYRDYINWQEKRYKKKCIGIDFRNKKKYGWNDHVETVFFKDAQADSKVYTNLFYSHYTLRESCNVCPYKSYEHNSDITIGDYWGIKSDFDDDKGVSLVLVQNNKGKKIFDSIKSDLIYIKGDKESSFQIPLKEPFSRHPKREKFWNDYRKYPFGYIARRYGKYGKLYKLLNDLKSIIK